MRSACLERYPSQEIKNKKMGIRNLKFTIITCVLHVVLGSLQANYISNDQEMWKHVVTLDRLAWKEREAEKQVNDTVSEEDFIRRIYLDITGKIPTYQQIKSYSQSKDLLKRQKLIDQLLNSKGYVSHLTNFWRDLLKIYKAILHKLWIYSLYLLNYSNKRYETEYLSKHEVWHS